MTFDPGRVQAIFLATFEQQTHADRLAVLDRECADDEEMRRRVEALLIAHDRPDPLPGRPFLGPGERAGSILDGDGDPAADLQERRP